MKIAVLSDIHGNLAALEAVAADIEKWGADHVIVNGDVVNRGAYSVACWRFVQEKQRTAGWLFNLGNHEEYVMAYTAEQNDDAHVMSYWVYQQFDPAEVALWGDLPEQQVLYAPDQTELRVRHASMIGSRDGISETSDQETVFAQIAPIPHVYCSGHIHFPYVRQFPGCLVVNDGSVGQPCDGDVRASYAQIRWESGAWQAEIARVAYDRARTNLSFKRSGFLDETGPVAQLIYHEWRTGEGILGPWRVRYRELVLAGELSEAEAIYSYLDELGYSRFVANVA